MIENVIVKQLQGIASELAGNLDLQKDLMQEMFLHLVRIQTAAPGQTASWYLRNCELHARNYLLKHGCGIVSSGPAEEAPHDDKRCANGALAPCPSIGPIEIQGEPITNDIANLILPLLSGRQRQVLFLLMKGCGVRQTARELGVTHPAVIKHRKKIARVAHELLQDFAGIGGAVHNGTNGNGEADIH